MQIQIDTPYMTIAEFTRRSGQSVSAVENEIKSGKYIIRPKREGSKAAVLLNMVHMTLEAAEQVERVRQAQAEIARKMPSDGTLVMASQAAAMADQVRAAKNSKPAIQR